jgi:hypothetical protein
MESSDALLTSVVPGLSRCKWGWLGSSISEPPESQQLGARWRSTPATRISNLERLNLPDAEGADLSGSVETTDTASPFAGVLRSAPGQDAGFRALLLVSRCKPLVAWTSGTVSNQRTTLTASVIEAPVSKLAYFFVTLVGAVPAGGALYLMIKNLLDRADRLGGVLLGVTITISVCMVLVALTPFMVLVFYKDTRPKPAPGKTDDDGEAAVAAAKSDDEEEAEGFGDIIPDDYDEAELAASVDDGGDLDEAYDDGDGEFEDDDYTGFDDDDEYVDFDDE